LRPADQCRRGSPRPEYAGAMWSVTPVTPDPGAPATRTNRGLSNTLGVFLNPGYATTPVTSRVEVRHNRGWRCAMEQRISLVTLGVADLDRARYFYEALGWSPTGPTDSVVFFQAGGMVLGLW